METKRVLIVSDSPDRVNFLKHHVQLHHMKPVRYPNHGAALRALKMDCLHMVVVDLTLPMDPKIELIKAACTLQKEARILAMGKTPYLENSEALKDFLSVELIPDIQEFPKTLAAQESPGSD